MRTINLSDNPQHHDNFHLVYRRPLQPKGDSIWEFVGYRCLNCDRVIRNDSTVPKHKLNCKAYVRKYPVEPKPVTILNIQRTEWTPFDIDAHENTKHSLK